MLVCGFPRPLELTSTTALWVDSKSFSHSLHPDYLKELVSHMRNIHGQEVINAALLNSLLKMLFLTHFTVHLWWVEPLSNNFSLCPCCWVKQQVKGRNNTLKRYLKKTNIFLCAPVTVKEPSQSFYKRGFSYFYECLNGLANASEALQWIIMWPLVKWCHCWGWGDGQAMRTSVLNESKNLLWNPCEMISLSQSVSQWDRGESKVTWPEH